MPTFDAQTLAQKLEGDLHGDNLRIHRLSTLDTLDSGAVAVLGDQDGLETVPPSALIVVAKPRPSPPPYISVENPRLALAQLTQLFDERPEVAQGVHPSALVHPEVQLGDDVHVGERAVIKRGVRLGAGTRIGAGCVVGEDAVLGQNCLLYPNVALYSGARLGNRVIVHSGAVIGADGFGYAASQRGAVKIHHLGGVVLEDDVEIGANTCIDRGTLSDTVVGARSKIDNLCQIGHNVRLGSDCFVAGTVGIAGSTTLGNRVTVGGAVGIGDHLSIGDDVRIAARAGVTKSIPAGETWAGFPAQPYKKWVRGLYLLGKLETVWQTLRKRDA